jgi:hypothetical protein
MSIDNLPTDRPQQILLQTTIPTTSDDWDISRFSLLQDYLASLQDDNGQPLTIVTARDRQGDANGDDPLLSHLSKSDFDQLWLFAVDIGDGLTATDCQGIEKFRQRGGGIFVARDHQDLGSSLCKLSGVCEEIGASHFFHSLNVDPDPDRHCADDLDTPTISWPNYHTGKNGDYQQIIPTTPIHPLLASPDRSQGRIAYFPAHPHEGSVGVPPGATDARVVAMGKSIVTDRTFNLAVAFDRQLDPAGNLLGRAVTASTFHHFCDYNWNPDLGCPSFVTEACGDGMKREPQALADTHAYVANLVRWLAPQTN